MKALKTIAMKKKQIQLKIIYSRNKLKAIFF